MKRLLVSTFLGTSKEHISLKKGFDKNMVNDCLILSSTFENLVNNLVFHASGRGVLKLLQEMITTFWQ